MAVVLIIVYKNKTRSPLVRLLLDSRKQWGWIALTVASALLSGVLQTAIARILGKMVDLGISGLTQAMLSQTYIMLILLIADCLRTSIHYTINALTTEKMFISLRMRAFSIITDGKVPVLEQRMRSGDVVTRLNSDMESLCELFAGRFSWLLRITLQGIVALVSCIFLSWQLSLTYFVLLPVSIWLIKTISVPIQRRQKEASDSTGKAMSMATDILSGLMVVKSFNLENEMNRRFNIVVDGAVEAAVKSELVGVRMTMIKYLVSIIQLMVLFMVGTLLVTSGQVTVGQVLAFVALSSSVKVMLDLSDNMIRSIRQGSALGQRLYEVLDLPVEEECEELIASSKNDYIELENLVFQYTDKSFLFKDLSLKLKQGQKIGLVGPSGCGKSSIIKLICKFYAHQGGQFSLFGQLAERWSPTALRKEIAIVTQDPYLFDVSIYENVLYGRLDATEDEVTQALKDAQLWDFIQTLDKGMYTRIGENGSRLSGGQKQRLSIARAILKDAPLVLLDEATSALDTQSEAVVQAALDRLLVGKAAVIVAHRLTTLKNVDYIYCIENGRVSEQGTHDELMEIKGYFFRMKIKQDLLVVKEGAFL